MPRGDGTGPTGGGPETGSTGSRQAGRGMGMGGGQGQGRGRMGGFSLGTGGSCVCPSCGRTASHQKGEPCTQVMCPNCGSNMTRNQ